MWMFEKTNVLEPWCDWWSGPEDLDEEKEGGEGEDGKGKKRKKRKKRGKLTMRKGKRVKKT